MGSIQSCEGILLEGAPSKIDAKARCFEGSLDLALCSGTSRDDAAAILGELSAQGDSEEEAVCIDPRNLPKAKGWSDSPDALGSFEEHELPKSCLRLSTSRGDFCASDTSE